MSVARLSLNSRTLASLRQGRQRTEGHGLCNPCELYGGAEGDRTPDLLNAIQALSQLSYNPLRVLKKCAAQLTQAWNTVNLILA